MHRKNEENVVYVLQKATEYLKINVTGTTVKEFLLAHPYYPTLKCICDALNKWKVENYALNLKLDEIKALEMPFIAHFKISGGQLAFVEKIKNNRVTYFISENKEITEPFEKFAEKLSGAVVVMEAGKTSGEKEYRKNRQNEILSKSLLPFAIITLAILLFSNFISAFDSQYTSFYTGFQFWGLIITKITGLTASVFLVLHELKIRTPIADKICGFSSKTDCDTVLSSNASRIFGWINWADAGILYFTGTLIYLLGITENLSFGIPALISVLALPYPVFSIYYQAFKAKKWCPFCLAVQLVLITEFVLLFPSLKVIAFTTPDITHFIVSILLPAAIWFVLRAYFDKTAELKDEHFSFLGFKRNPDIFKFLLQQNGFVEIQENKDSIILGNPDAPVTVTAFLSLYCNPCAGAFKKLKVLLDDCNDIKINVKFSVYNDEESFKLINYLYFLYNGKGQRTATEFLYNWYSTDKKSRKLFYEKDIPEDLDIAEEKGKTNKTLFDKFKVSGTPTVFIQGYKFPTQFDYKDIEFYIDDIKQLTGESKRQEACINCK